MNLEPSFLHTYLPIFIIFARPFAYFILLLVILEAFAGNVPPFGTKVKARVGGAASVEYGYPFDPRCLSAAEQTVKLGAVVR